MEMFGKKFNKWTVLQFIGQDKKSNKIYLCRCDCGTTRDQRLSMIINGNSVQCKSCSTIQRQNSKDLTNKTFGLWKVLDKVKNQERNEWYYRCECECGTVQNVARADLVNSRSTRCIRCRVKTHGMSQTDTFRIWAGMFRRCLNKNFKAYKYYGGRGIKICKRWFKFENFLEDMGMRPSGLQIDRIDNDGNYEPGNCRWATPAQNHANKPVCKKKEIN